MPKATVTQNAKVMNEYVMTVLQSREEVRAHCAKRNARQFSVILTCWCAKGNAKEVFSHNDSISDTVKVLSSIVPRVLV